MPEPRLPPDVHESLSVFRKLLVRRFGPRLKELRLFGSYARGDASEESDVDVLVLLEGATRAEVDEAVALEPMPGL